MNKVILMGRLTKDPDVRYTQDGVAVARYSLAVDRRYQREGEQKADFISCTAFGRGAEFAEKYLKKGTKIVAAGRIQTGSYTNRDGQKVYTTDVIVEEQEFAESKKAQQENEDQRQENGDQQQETEDGFMRIPDSLEDDTLPFV